MITLNTFTRCDEVRAVLGVDSQELPDATIGLSVYISALYRALVSFTDSSDKNLLTYFNSFDLQHMSDEDTLLYYTIKEYATYVVAETCGSSISMFALKSESDGKATQTRFSSDATFQDVLKRIRERLATLSGLLDEMLGSDSSYSIPSISLAPIGVNLVTNE